MMEYPPVGFHFLVEFDLSRKPKGDTMFQEVSGLTVDVELDEVIEGGENRFVHRLPKRTKYNELILKRGLIVDSKILDWCKEAIENFNFVPVNIDITLLNEEHDGIMAWNVVNAIPMQWSVSNFNANENAIVVETLKLSYNYFRTIKV